MKLEKVILYKIIQCPHCGESMKITKTEFSKLGKKLRATNQNFQVDCLWCDKEFALSNVEDLRVDTPWLVENVNN